MKKEPLVWNVIYHSVNEKKITTCNIFHHGRFMADVEKALKKCQTREEFAEAVRHSLMYYFWSKCEWEVVISPWCGGNGTEDIKIDVYWQVMNNWEIFVDYVWNTKKKRNNTKSADM